MKKAFSTLRQWTAAAAIPLAGLACAADPAIVTLAEKETLIVPGKNPEKRAGGKASFIIDARRAKWNQMLWADHIVTLFNGEATAGRKCLFINLKKRNYNAQEIETDIYHVETDATETEMDLVRQYGCVVTTKPEWSKIKFLNKGPA